MGGQGAPCTCSQSCPLSFPVSTGGVFTSSQCHQPPAYLSLKKKATGSLWSPLLWPGRGWQWNVTFSLENPVPSEQGDTFNWRLGWDETLQAKKKKGRRVLSQFVDAKWNYFDRFSSPTLKDPEFLISDLKTRSFTHDLTNYTIHNALRLIRHLLTPCQNSSQALFWVGIFKLLSFLGYPLFWCILYWQYFSQSWKLSSAESMLL